MGGGRSGLFHGTAGADVYQQSLFEEPVNIRLGGATYLPNEESATIGSASVGGCFSDKLRVLTAKDILKKFMDYRFRKISESELIYWLQAILKKNNYYIELSLRNALTKGLAGLKATKTGLRSYDCQRFLVEIEKIENEMFSE